MRNYFKLLKRQKGFTLIELLVVIGILGILAATVLIAINPLEQFARGRDSGRLTTVDQLGHAIQANYTNTSQYVAENAAGVSWLQALVNSQDIKTQPVNSPYTANGATNPVCGGGFGVSNWCYDTNGPEAIVYTRVESRSNCTKSRNGTACTAADQNSSWIVWTSVQGRSGLYWGGTPVAGGAITLY